MGLYRWHLLSTTLLLLAVVLVGKMAGCMLGVRLGRLSMRDAWAISFGMNARGAMEIILGLLALQYGVIQEDLFVALVVLALLSSIVSGPLMNHFIRRPKEWKLEDLLVTGHFVSALEADTREEAIQELAYTANVRSG